MRSGLDQRTAAEEIAELHDDESQKQQVQDRQRNANLNRPETYPDRACAERVRGHESPFLSRRQQVSEKPAQDPGPSADEEHALDERHAQGGDRRGDELLENSIRGNEEGTENEQQRHPEREAARHRDHPWRSRPLGELGPADIGHQQRQGTGDRRTTGSDGALPVVAQRRGL